MSRVVLRRQVSESSGQSTPMPDNNLIRLKRISQSFEDLTSETLYSKWKRARKNSSKTDRRGRSISLSSLAEEEFDINGNAQREGANNTAATLQRDLFRPRGWTVCNGQLSRDNNPKGVVNTSNIYKDSLSDDAPSLSGIGADISPMFTTGTSENLDDDIFSLSAAKPETSDAIETKKHKIISEIISGNSFKVRSFSDCNRRIIDRPSLRCRLTSDPESSDRSNTKTRARSLSCREPREIEFLRTAEMAHNFLDGASVPPEGIWQKRNSTGDLVAEGRHKRMSPSSVIHARPEVNNNPCNIQEASLGFPYDRSQPDPRKRYLLGCTYALIRQPEPQISNSTHEGLPKKINYQDRILNRTMSEPSKGLLAKKESRSTEEKERDDRTVQFKQVEIVSDFKGSPMTEHSHHGVKRAQTLPRMPKRPLASLTSRNWKESELKTRKAAEDLIHNINNSDEKSAQERVDIVETAFEWIRKEVADLRAQDKDIMRMFTKIQAGIRHIKFDQSSLMESEEEFISTPDLSSTQSSSGGNAVHRRASLL